MPLDFTPIKRNLSKHCYPAGDLLSVYLLGTSSDRSTLSAKSDLDLLFIIKDTVASTFLNDIGVDFRKSLGEIFEGRKVFLFDSPSYDRPDIVQRDSIRIHLLVHKEGWVRHSLDTNNWVFVCWSNKNKLLLGKSTLDPQQGVLNHSIIDEFDGLPSMVRRIDFSLVSYDVEYYQAYFIKLVKYCCSRYNEIVQTFSQLRFSTVDLAQEKIELDDIYFVRELLTNLTNKIRSLLGSGVNYGASK